jgi:hypothetical protein
MPEVIFTGPAGRLEGRYHPAKQKNAPIAMVLHPHPQFHGTMNHQIIYQCYYAFVHRGFSVLRFNFRGVGAGLGAEHQPRGACLLGRGLLVRRMDRHAVADAPSGSRGLHLDRAAGQPL